MCYCLQWTSHRLRGCLAIIIPVLCRWYLCRPELCHQQAEPLYVFLSYWYFFIYLLCIHIIYLPLIIYLFIYVLTPKKAWWQRDMALWPAETTGLLKSKHSFFDSLHVINTNLHLLSLFFVVSSVLGAQVCLKLLPLFIREYLSMFYFVINRLGLEWIHLDGKEQREQLWHCL